MVVRFHVVSPVAKQRTFTVRLPIMLGRGEEAKFRIQHDLVSRRHCEFFERQGQVYVRDLGSTNGTFLNDEQVPASTKTAVSPGAVVRVGGLSFAVDYQPSSVLDSSATVEGQGHHGGPATGESRVGSGVGSGDGGLDELPDFKVEHADEGVPHAGEAAAAVGDAEEPPAAEVAAAEVALPEVALPEVALPEVALPEVALPEVALPEIEAAAANPDQPEGFAFLAGGEAAASQPEVPQWPSADTAAEEDVPDDDQLNAFFKGLK
jgi:predicted component of type VI protein secretion system